MNNMDDGDGSRRNRKPNYSRDEVLTIICGVQENKFCLLKKSCTVSSNKAKLAGWKAICDRLNFFNPDRQRTVDEVRKKWKDLSAQARSDMLSKRSGGPDSSDGGQDGEAGGGSGKDSSQGEFTQLILAILADVGSVEVSNEESGIMNLNLVTLGSLGEAQTDNDTTVYRVIQKTDPQPDGSHLEHEVKIVDPDSRKRLRKPNYTKKDILTLIQGVSDHKFTLLQKHNNHTSNKVKTEGWNTICETVNAYNIDVERTTEELRKKWKDLTTQARSDLANLRAALAAGNSKPRTPPGEFTSLCLPILAQVGVCDVTAEEINALKVNTMATVISLNHAGEFVTTSQANILPAVIEKDCDTFVNESGAFNTTGLIGATTHSEPSAPAEYALSTLASVSASKLKEKIREKLASGSAASQSDISDFQAAQAELQAVGVEVRLIENHHQQQQQQQQILDSGNNHHHQHHITLDDSSIISSSANTATIITNQAQQHQQQQHVQSGLPTGVTIHTNNNNSTLQISSQTPHQIFRAADILNTAVTNNSLKRKHPGNNNSENTTGNSILTAAGNIISSSGGHTHHNIVPIPVSLHASSLSAPVTILTGTPVLASAAASGNASIINTNPNNSSMVNSGSSNNASSPTPGMLTPADAERQALEREKLVAEVEVLRLQKMKLRLELEVLLQQRQSDCGQLLEDCLK